MRFVWTRRHTRAGQAHARVDARGGDTVELHEADKPWAALMIPHYGGDTQRDNGFIKPHTRRIPRNIPKGAKQTMSACTPCALRFYTSSTARGRYTHSRPRGDETPTRGEERRERSSASALQQRVILKCNGENFRDSETRGMVSLSCEERREGGGSQLEPREGGVGSPQARHRAPRAGRARAVRTGYSYPEIRY